MQPQPPLSRAWAVGERVLLSVPVRVVCGAVSILGALAFIPLGLVLPPERWVVSTGLAWTIATAGVIGLVRRRTIALPTPFVLIAVWFLVQW